MSDYVMVRRELLEDIISTLDYEGATSWTEALRSSLAPVVLDDGDLTEIARDAALASVDRHNYMPATREDANNWTPHIWVIDAMRTALHRIEEAQSHDQR